MKKIILLFILLLPTWVCALELPDTYSSNVLIYDLTDEQILFEKNSSNQTYIASLTKIMTTITALEKNPDITKQILLTNEVFAGIPWDASVAGLKEGDLLTIEDLLYASILPSGADATQALAISSSGSVANFVKEMNELARNIGVENTNFVNVTGLDVDNHYSTAADILKILRYALKNPVFKKIYCTREYTMSNNKVVRSSLLSYNKNLNLDISKIIGSKTGYTSKAGFCISVLTNIYDHEVLIITINAPPIIKEAYNVRDALNLIEFLENNFSYKNIINSNTMIKSIPVQLSKITDYSIYATKDISKFLPNDYDPSLIEIKYQGLESLDFNNKVGDKIGNAEYYYAGKLLDQEEIFLTRVIEIDYIKYLLSIWYIVFPLCMGILLVIILASSKHKRKRK